MQDHHDPYEALRVPAYRRLLSGNVLASIGTEMQSVAVGWELYQRTDSAAALGLVGLVQFVPVVLLSLPAGHSADRYNRKRLLVAAQLLMCSVSVGLAAFSYFQAPVPLTYLCLLLGGVSQAFNSPARWALVPQVVPPSALTNAITWNSSGWQIASVVGPALGGLIVAATNQAGGAYLAAGLCALACAVLVAPVQPRASARSREPLSLGSLLAGVRFVRQTRIILATITLDLFAVLLGGATALLPIFARDILRVGPSGLGWLRAAPSLGALLMAMVLAHRPPLRRAGPALLCAVTGFGVATIVFGLSRNFGLSLAMLALSGALDNISVVVRGTLVQVFTPDAMRGRVSAVNAIFISSSNQLGGFESGITAAWFGPVVSVVGGGIGTILVVLAVMLMWPEVRQLRSLHQQPLDFAEGNLIEAAKEQEINTGK
jgi:MFS family permease